MSAQPVLSVQNAKGRGYSPFGFTYNPSWVQASAGTNGVAGIFVRLQNCSRIHKHCSGEGSTGFAPCDLEAGTCGDLWTNFTLNGSDPRVVYHDGLYYNFHEEGGGVGLSTSPTPLDAARPPPPRFPVLARVCPPIILPCPTPPSSSVLYSSVRRVFWALKCEYAC